MGTVHLSVYARSDVGRVREHNEDAFAVSDLDSGERVSPPAVNLDVRDRGVLMVVSDGMGGHAAGEVASELVVESLRSTLSDPAADHSSVQRLIDNAVRRANADVWKAARDEKRRGMGATVTAVLVHDTEAFVATVGDSRAYLLREGRIRQITKDQSFVQALIDAGVMTPEDAKNAPSRNVILQAMGLKPEVKVAIGRLRLRQGDRFLLCSDGLTTKVNDDELQGLLGHADLATACARMIDLANERGGDDNLTAIVAQVDGDGLPALVPGVHPPHPTVEILQAWDGRDPPERAVTEPDVPALGGPPTVPESPRAPEPASAPASAPAPAPAPPPPGRRLTDRQLALVLTAAAVLAVLAVVLVLLNR